MIDHDQQASAHNADIPYDILKQAAMLLVKAREAEQRRLPIEAERLRSNARHMLGLPASTSTERAIFPIDGKRRSSSRRG
jgi:hypothetical protein